MFGVLQGLKENTALFPPGFISLLFNLTALSFFPLLLWLLLKRDSPARQVSFNVKSSINIFFIQIEWGFVATASFSSEYK